MVQSWRMDRCCLFLMASFLIYSFPFFRLQLVLVFNQFLKTSGSHFRFLEVC